VFGCQKLLKGKRMGRKPNYGYEKRQKELARKAKKEEKRKLKAEEKDSSPEENCSLDEISQS